MEQKYWERRGNYATLNDNKLTQRSFTKARHVFLSSDGKLLSVLRVSALCCQQGGPAGGACGPHSTCSALRAATQISPSGAGRSPLSGTFPLVLFINGWHILLVI